MKAQFVSFSSNRLVSGQRATLETVPPPRDQLSLGGQSELVLWWFVSPLQCFVTNAQRLKKPLHGTSFFGDHRGIVFGNLSCMVIKNLAHRCSAPRQFRLCGRRQSFASFNLCTYSWKLEQKELRKTRKEHIFWCDYGNFGKKNQQMHNL